MALNDITDKIEQNLSTIDSKNSKVELGFFGGSFTCLTMDEQKKYLATVIPYIINGRLKSIRISTRPDYINEEILHFLRSMHVGTIELGVQSMDDEVLTLSGRGHNPQHVIQASHLIKSYGFNLGLQMMVGLPGDTAGKSLQTAQRIIELKPDCVRIFPTLVIKNTKLAELHQAGVYKALFLSEAIEWTAPVLKLFIDNQINVIRVGLHPSEEFEGGEKLIAGPYHPSFRELVMTQIWHQQFAKIQAKVNSDITVSVPATAYNSAIGYNASNKKYLKQKFGRVRFSRSEKLKDLEYHVDYC